LRVTYYLQRFESKIHILHLRSTYVLLIFAIFVTKPYVFMLIFMLWLRYISLHDTRAIDRNVLRIKKNAQATAVNLRQCRYLMI
jgi:hypothetical protein